MRYSQADFIHSEELKEPLIKSVSHLCPANSEHSFAAARYSVTRMQHGMDQYPQDEQVLTSPQCTRWINSETYKRCQNLRIKQFCGITENQLSVWHYTTSEEFDKTSSLAC